MSHRPGPQRLAAVLLSATLLGGCATLLPKLEAPRLTLLAVTINAVSPTQQQLRLRMHAENPNARAIAVRGIDITLEISGERVAQGATAGAFSLPAQGATDFELGVTADLNEVLRLMTAALGHHSVDYRLYGSVHLQGGLLPTLPFDQRGRVQL
jgi:LEA14-like dessication related protein